MGNTPPKDSTHPRMVRRRNSGWEATRTWDTVGYGGMRWDEVG